MKTPDPQPVFFVRQALPADVDTVLELAVGTVLTSRSELRPDVSDRAIQDARRRNLSTLEQILDLPEGGLFVAEDAAGTLIGHIIVLANNVDSVTEERQAWIYDVSVRPQWREYGVGTKLMQAAESFAAGFGLAWIGLGVTACNRGAVSFYEQLGYGIERYQMVKKLEKSS